ncbi:hypothetical protein ACS91J_17380 [Pectobacterium carotovorum]|uniref:hypothetical protein n=1 Tax=Pectobacterium odoriferum TaxID=78398 RepID=UPI001373EEAA|nr:hypothetical protein [Pectobacterium odoriferum]QHP81169.1 hypothetical protein EO763_15260 [Pectobacterium odoriferum]GKW01194.1 hypothetical protein PEC301877_00090 [Pectobacterium carotovorum subsp. carotovorum]
MKYNPQYRLLLVSLASLIFITACQTEPVTIERNKNIKIVSPFSGSSPDGQCYKITAENKDYYGRLDKDGHPLQIPEIENKDIKISLRLLSDSDCKEKGI